MEKYGNGGFLKKNYIWKFFFLIVKEYEILINKFDKILYMNFYIYFCFFKEIKLWKY